MTILKPELTRRFAGLLTLSILCALPCANLLAARIADDVAFPEKFKFRLAYYVIDRADTTIAVFNSRGIGAGYSFARDLGGDSEATTPRIDLHYRFNARHRIEFSRFRVERDGIKIIELNIDLGDESFRIGETLNSNLSYDLYRLGYSYSFLHSESVELAVTAGLNISEYEFDFTNADGSGRSEGATSDVPRQILTPVMVQGFIYTYILEKLKSEKLSMQVDHRYEKFLNGLANPSS